MQKYPTDGDSIDIVLTRLLIGPLCLPRQQDIVISAGYCKNNGVAS